MPCFVNCLSAVWRFREMLLMIRHLASAYFPCALTRATRHNQLLNEARGFVMALGWGVKTISPLVCWNLWKAEKNGKRPRKTRVNFMTKCYHISWLVIVSIRNVNREAWRSPPISNYLLLTCTCVGIHPGRVEPASPIALTTSRTEAFQARRSCSSSLDTFTQSFLHRAWPKTSQNCWNKLFRISGNRIFIVW